jgi:hypothetical protein
MLSFFLVVLYSVDLAVLAERFGYHGLDGLLAERGLLDWLVSDAL